MVAKPNVLDSILQDEETGAVELVLGVEAGEWGLPDVDRLLKDKLDHYAQFALDGEMFRRFEGTEGKPVALTVVSVDPVPSRFEKFLAKVKDVLAGEGLTVTVVRAPQPRAA